jgi:hypothetical protein
VPQVHYTEPQVLEVYKVLQVYQEPQDMLALMEQQALKVHQELLV